MYHIMFMINRLRYNVHIDNPMFEDIHYKYPLAFKMAEIAFDDQVDITDKVCPLTFLKAHVAIEELDDGEVLAIRMNDGEPVQNVPRSMKEEGHKILKLEDNEDGTYTLYVRKVEE